MWTDHTILSVARLSSAFLAALLFAAALGAYNRTRRRSLLALAIGAGTMALGFLAAGTLVELLGWTVAEATMIESLFTLLAVTLLVASLYLRDPAQQTIKRAAAEPPEVAHG